MHLAIAREDGLWKLKTRVREIVRNEVEEKVSKIFFSPCNCSWTLRYTKKLETSFAKKRNHFSLPSLVCSRGEFMIIASN